MASLGNEYVFIKNSRIFIEFVLLLNIVQFYFGQCTSVFNLLLRQLDCFNILQSASVHVGKVERDFHLSITTTGTYYEVIHVASSVFDISVPEAQNLFLWN